MPTLRPGCTLVPSWRMMMLPAMTFSPPYFFTPWNFGFESRPLRDEPTPFLCAISLTETDVVDFHFGEALPVSLLSRVVLPALHLEDDDLVAAAVAEDFARPLGLPDPRR